MAFQARCVSVFVASMLLYVLLINCEAIQAKKYVIGGGGHWDNTIDEESWPKGKTFYAGDVLEFINDNNLFDVVVTDKEGHDSCTVTANSTRHGSGHDFIQVHYGNNYIICSNADDCQGGMKLAIWGNKPKSSFN